jgi:hypothetical protein
VCCIRCEHHTWQQQQQQQRSTFGHPYQGSTEARCELRDTLLPAPALVKPPLLTASLQSPLLTTWIHINQGSNASQFEETATYPWLTPKTFE